MRGFCRGRSFDHVSSNTHAIVIMSRRLIPARFRRDSFVMEGGGKKFRASGRDVDKARFIKAKVTHELSRSPYREKRS